ncbi:DUF1097 family protein [Vagococcus acidifermentans]|uniref:DUF1097 domain-containing protein n=1 Tax=Vagococcus acidifermentans TaxID=564710 RepID=A0A430AWZ7_9ENTE|nr:DUF1097 family protein [Vagococcus acidifermentans]RSU12578.1 hypothetical protein CBF27_06285 [Vagococcus acidifermentans]
MKSNFLLCLVIALINLSGTLLIGKLEIGQFIWISFLALQFYFMGNIAMRKKECLQMFVSFTMGLVWGQLSNFIWHYFSDLFSFLSINFIDGGLLIFLLCIGAVIVFDNKLPGCLPATFTGLTVTILLWGRPAPFIGQGLLGDKTITVGILIACAMYAYGLTMAFMMDLVYIKITDKLKDN